MNKDALPDVNASSVHSPKFTPGPWKINSSRISQTSTFEIASESYRSGQDSACWIAQVLQPHIHGEANAHLIAAAPDLYAALKGLRDAAADEAGADHDHPRYSEWLSAMNAAMINADAALKKACAETTKERGEGL